MRQSAEVQKKYGKLQARPQSARRLRCSRETRFLDFPWGTKVGWPLREIGVLYAGFDLLAGRFEAGTPCSDTHLLYFLVSGGAECRNAAGVFPMKAGSWMACPAGQPHWIRHGRGRSEAIWVHLMDLPRWEFLGRRGPGLFRMHDPAELRHSLFRAVHEAAQPEPDAFESASAYSRIFRVCLQREISRAFARPEPGRGGELARLWAEVSGRLAEPWTVARLARRVHMSESALYGHVARCHGMKPMQMVTHLRMERARDLLLHSDGKLETIAEAVGYQTAFSFSDAFVRETGMRPGRFRLTAARLPAGNLR